MKKYKIILPSLLMLLALTLTTVQVSAQADPIPLDDEPSSLSASEEESQQEATDETEVKTPDTGIGPMENKLLGSGAVFVGGSVAGALIGLGYLQFKKRSIN